jgi:hypothetical protein
MWHILFGTIHVIFREDYGLSNDIGHVARHFTFTNLNRLTQSPLDTKWYGR